MTCDLPPLSAPVADWLAVIDTLSGDSIRPWRPALDWLRTDPQRTMAAALAAASPDWRSRVAWHPHAPAEALAALATDISVDVRSGVAGNLRTPAAVLIALATDPSADVRSWVANNPLAPVKALLAMAGDPVADARSWFAWDLSTLDSPAIPSITTEAQTMPKHYPTIAGHRILQRQGCHIRVEHPTTGRQAVIEWREDDHQVIGLPVKDSSPPVRPVSHATAGGIDHVSDWVSPATARRRFASITGDLGW